MAGVPSSPGPLVPPSVPFTSVSSAPLELPLLVNNFPLVVVEPELAAVSMDLITFDA